jgi:phosphoribosylanthranilate isomerase
MKLKICGMKYPWNYRGVAHYQTIWFIFWEKSSRYFDGMIPELPKSIKTGVFVDESIAIIIEKSQK